MSTLLQVEALGRTFGGIKAVSNLSFSVTKGQILGLIGPNGAGKTTVVNLVSGAMTPSSGRILFAGEDVTRLPPHKRARKGLVRTFQSTAVYSNQTVRENAYRGAFLKLYPGFVAALVRTPTARRMEGEAAELVQQLLEWLDLEDVADITAGSLPYGFQKTLGIVIALAAEPQLILLDEPVAGLSAEETDHVRDTVLRVRERGVSVVVIDHNMRFISGLCDSVVVIAHGQELAQGKPQEVLRNQAVIEAYLGTGYAAAHAH
jgi:branched-chain amino acid transport system ATP-binding protein